MLPYTGHMSQTTIRSFFACKISAQNLSTIEQQLTELRAGLPRTVKWVNPENMHLTIKFIGAFNPVYLDQLHTSLAGALGSIKPFKLDIGGMGVFPSFSKPKVIWVGINAKNTLKHLAKIVNDECANLNYPPEKRPFSAHITLGRVKSYVSQDDYRSISSEIKARESNVIGSQTIESLYFFQSDRTTKGPIYKILFNLPFSV